MKILTKEEEEAHYNATLRGGISGGLIGLGVVSFPYFQLSIPLNCIPQSPIPLSTKYPY